jgi:hypothetical protein
LTEQKKALYKGFLCFLALCIGLAQLTSVSYDESRHIGFLRCGACGFFGTGTALCIGSDGKSYTPADGTEQTHQKQNYQTNVVKQTDLKQKERYTIRRSNAGRRRLQPVRRIGFWFACFKAEGRRTRQSPNPFQLLPERSGESCLNNEREGYIDEHVLLSVSGDGGR